MSKDNPEENYKRFPALLAPKQLEAIGDYQAEFRPVLSKAEAIRDLIDLGLKTYWENKKKGEHRED